MKKILCPTDFSAVAENGIAYAAKLAKKIGSSLHLLHVHLLSDVTPEEALVGAGLSQELAKQKLEKECEEVSRVFKVSCYPEEPRSGISLSKQISDVASGFDMIVMGTNGEDGAWQDFIGSNTFNVIRKTSVPLLMIPEECGCSDIQHIVFAYDYWRNENMPVSQVLNLAKSLSAKVTIVQVMETYSRDAESELEATQKMILQTYSEEGVIGFETLYDDDIGEAVNQFIIRTGADMLVMCFHPGKFQKMFYSGIVRRVTTETAYPLFVFH